MRSSIFILIFSLSLFGFSQKRVIFIAHLEKHISNIELDMNLVNSIRLTTNSENEVLFEVKSEGEYASYFAINQYKKNNTLFLKGCIDFTYPGFQDKLSAHKKHAITLTISLPQNRRIVLSSKKANVVLSGVYQSLLVDLMRGDCQMYGTSGAFRVSSVYGDLILTATSGAIEAETSNGLCSIDRLNKGDSMYHLQTNKGNITVIKK